MVKSRNIGRGGRIDGLPPVAPEITPTPDRHLTYHQDGVRWQFKDGKILVNDLDVGKLISDSHEEVTYWIGLSDGLNEYRKKMTKWARRQEQWGRFTNAVDALLNTLLRHLKKSYDRRMTGLSWTMEHGQFVLNGINVRSFLDLYRLRRTEKARKFLKGLKAKLATLLQHREESPHYDQVRQVVAELYRELEQELPDETTASLVPLLPSRARSE